ncbi:hypothetical protein HID58_088631 [Brassica napus]|uniref:Uncharacterized protein n=1 Tax=Brassica napus TaxID=3708 RepID=A0ABQ7XZN2_BRANA|nr:hypothetical protein HID58_088631 [Brassica napus]
MVLLENYSAPNYTGLTQDTEELIKESESMLDRCCFPETPRRESDGTESADVQAEHKRKESLHMRSTIAALRVLKEIRSKSFTVSVFSLPPLQLNGVDETWKKIPLMEQEAK